MNVVFLPVVCHPSCVMTFFLLCNLFNTFSPFSPEGEDSYKTGKLVINGIKLRDTSLP